MVHGFSKVAQAIDNWFEDDDNTKNNRTDFNNKNESGNKAEGRSEDVGEEKEVMKKLDEKKRETTEDSNCSNTAKSAGRVLKRTYTAAIQDDYAYWSSHKESDVSGKLFFVTPNTSCQAVDVDCKTDVNSNNDGITNNNNNNDNNSIKNNSNIRLIENEVLSDRVEIFFDDNIERDRAHIVDARCTLTFKPLPFSETKDVYMAKVEPYYAITDENYFIDLLHDVISKQMKARTESHGSLS